jgi:hypothetical protein
MVLTGGNRSTVPRAMKNPTWTVVRLKPGLRGDKPAATKYIVNVFVLIVNCHSVMAECLVPVPCASAGALCQCLVLVPCASALCRCRCLVPVPCAGALCLLHVSDTVNIIGGVNVLEVTCF